MRRRWRALGVGLLAGLAPGVGWASEGQVSLRWEAPRECIDRGALGQAIEQTLGRPVVAERAAAVIEGKIEPGPRGGFRATLSLVAGGEALARREVSAPRDCRKLDEALAVVAAIMIDNWLSTSPTPLSVPAPTAPMQAPAASPEPAAPVAPAAPSALELRTGLLAGATAGLLPEVTPHAGLHGGVGLAGGPGLRASLLAHGTSRALVDGSGGTFTAWTGALDVCQPLARGRVELGACAGAGGGRLSAGAVGLTRAAQLGRPLAFGRASAAAALRVAGPLWVGAEAGAWVSILRDSFVFTRTDGATQAVHRPAAVVPALSLVLELRSSP